MSNNQDETPKGRTDEHQCKAHNSARTKGNSGEIEFVCIPSDQLSEPDLESLVTLFAQAIVRKLIRSRNG